MTATPDQYAPAALSGDKHRVLSIEELALARGGRTVAAGLTAQFSAHSTTILRGANGAGKTTLLRTIAGFLSPTDGTITLYTNEDSEPSAATEAARRRACVFFGHANGVKKALSVEENLNFWCGLYGVRDRAAARASLDAVGLGPLAARRAETLSAGQRRRLGLARVLVSGKSIWLLDEPTASMDAASIDRFCTLVDQQRQRGGCIIIATHDQLALEAQNLMLAPPNGGAS